MDSSSYCQCARLFFNSSQTKKSIFYIFSALCTTLQQFKRLEKTFGEFIYLRYIVGRWLRLAPALLGSILALYLLPLTGKGPLWFFNEKYVVAPCKNSSSLLSTFLYYSNWNDPLDDYLTRPTLNIVSIYFFNIRFFLFY